MSCPQTPYIRYEYKAIPTTAGDVSRYLDCYENFGWQLDENRPAPGGSGTVTLYLRRDRQMANRMELTRLQRNFEACLREISLLERSKTQAASLWALLTGALGTAFLAGSVFAITHEPPQYLLMVLLAVPGFTGWIVPSFLYRRLLLARERTVRPLVEAKYEEIDQLCEKGHDLLS